LSLRCQAERKAQCASDADAGDGGVDEFHGAAQYRTEFPLLAMEYAPERQATTWVVHTTVDVS
jgi:hypothetical protein